MEFEQKSFIGGMNLLDVDTNLKEDEYRMVINGRARFGEIQPIFKSTLQTGLPTGNYQGGLTIGNIVLVFINGLAYYKAHTAVSWLPVPLFVMDAVAPKIWTLAIPKSDRNYMRKAGDSANKPIIVQTDVRISGNQAGILVQDNINQPWLIQFDEVSQTFTARITKNYNQWVNTSVTIDDREYVPIGNMMMFINQKLYIVARDKRSLYHSITGRPLDFMVNIDEDGNKLPSEVDGGVDSVSFAFDNDDITCIRDINVTDSFLYGTARRSRVIQLDYTNTILGEPTYLRLLSIEAGIVNDESAINTLGDYVLVDNDGIKSFNAAASIYVEGRNSLFSAPLHKLFNGIIQTEPAAINFDNYLLFYCKTTMGNIILVYDELRTKWISFDITEVSHIKKFMVLSNGAVDALYALCDGELWLMYSSVESEMCQTYIAALTPSNGKIEHKGQFIKPIFRGGTTSGTLRVIEYADEQLSDQLMRDLAESIMSIAYPVQIPVIPSSIPNMKSPSFVLTKGLAGKKLSYIVLWNTNAALQAIKIQTSEQDGDAASRQNN